MISLKAYCGCLGSLNIFESFCSGMAGSAKSSLEEFCDSLEEIYEKHVIEFENTDDLGDAAKDARKWYLEQEAKIPNLIDDSIPLEQQARQAFELRNQYRRQARELMSDQQLAEFL